jgi:MFS family permease
MRRKYMTEHTLKKNSGRSLLKNRDFVLLMCGKFVSVIGSQMQIWALSLYILETTGSTVQFSAVLALQFIPQLIIQPVAGVLVDRLDRKKIIVGLDFLSGICVGIFAFIFNSKGVFTLGPISILVMILAAISSVFQPAVITAVPVIVDRDKLVTANSTNAFIMSVGFAAAPFIAGMVFGSYGLFFVLILNSISFILSAISEIFIRIPMVEKHDSKFSFQEFKEDFMGGLRFVLSSRTMIGIIGIAFALNLVIDAVADTAPTTMLEQILMVSKEQQGFLKTIALASMLVAPVVCGLLAKKMSMKKVLYTSVVTIGSFIAVFSMVVFLNSVFTFNYIVPYMAILVILFFLKMFETMSSISLSTACQQEAPREMLGRVGTLMSTSMTASAPIGLMVFGAIFEYTPLYVGIAIAAIALLTAAIFLRPLLINEKIKMEENEAAITK